MVLAMVPANACKLQERGQRWMPWRVRRGAVRAGNLDLLQRSRIAEK